jgi:hypothetical protein
MRVLLLVILIVLLIALLPTWPYSTGWGISRGPLRNYPDRRHCPAVSRENLREGGQHHLLT